ncbi:MAG: LamG-like jellyroll fold domain-containing protein, partial [Candidatus Thorarchaeota archaeon]
LVLVDREEARRSLQYKKDITVDYTKVAADLTDYPLLIDITDTDLHDDVLPSGEDIAFLVNGQFVEHEIEFFDRDYSPSEAHLIAWVKVPFLSSSSDTVITMLYGNSDARSLETSGVWSNYEMVHHMNEAPNGTLVDSSGNLHYGSSFGGMTYSQLVPGPIGGSIDFDGSNDAITVGQIDTDDWPSFTVTGWVSQDVSGDDRVFAKAPDTVTGNAIIQYAIDDTTRFRVRMNTDGTGGGPSNSVDSNALTTPSNWVYLAWSWSAATASMSLYVNGTLDKTVARDGDTVLDSIVPFVIGNWQTGTANNRFLNGKVDELRLTRMALSDGWIETEFNNQLNPSTFYSVGSEQAASVGNNYQAANVIFSTESIIPINIGYTLDIGYEGVGTSLDENFSEGTSFSISNGSATVDWTAKVLISPPLGTVSVEMLVNYPASDWTPISVYNPLNQQKSNPADWEYSGGVLTIKASAIDIYGVWTLNFVGENHVSDFKLGESGQALGGTGSFNDEDEVVFQGLTPFVTSAASQLKLIDPTGTEWYSETNTTVGGTSHEIPTFQYRKDIIVDYTLVDADLTHFPLLVDLIDPDFHDAQKVQSDGDDILFVQNGIVAAHEVQAFDRNYDSSNGQLIAWVKVNLSSTVDTTITMYYGNPLIGPQERPSEVWSDDYMGVWHLEESPTGALHEIDDSTSYENDGTAEGSTLGYASTTSAKVGSGLSFDEVDDLIRMNDSSSLDSVASSGTFQLWIWWDNAIDGDWQTIMASSNAFSGVPNDGYEWAVQNDGDHYFYPWRGSGSCYNLDSAPVFINQQWHHLAVTLEYSSSDVKIYLDGNPLAFAYVGALSFWTQIASSGDILWGGHPDTANRYFDGMFDEIRASSVVRSEEWLATEFANQNSPSTFYSVGSEVERSQVSPSFKKTMTSAPAGMWTALVRYNDSGSDVNYMVGAYERNFIIRHDVSLSLQSPGDAASSGVSVRLAGEMLHVEVELTDDDASSQPVNGATVTMNWTDTGNPTEVTLADYGTGVYGVALNTSDLATAGSWRIDIQSSHEYYNDASTSFDLKLYHKTILKFQWLTTTPVGLDTTLTLVYTSAFDGTPIEDATISFANGTEITPDWQGGGMYNITLGSASL